MINVFLFSEKHVKINKRYIDKEEKPIMKQINIFHLNAAIAMG